MKFRHLIRALVLVALPMTFAGRGSANALHGRVTGVLDGGTISLVSLNHEVRIKLVGVAPPEQTQAYAAAARQHLSDLILEKYVVVRYSGLGRDYIAGRVLLNETDIGEQMIRDGVAWYDRSDESSLSEEDRQSYAACEQTAREERRGLWQDEAPVAPWEFRKAELAKAEVYAPPPPRARASVRTQTKATYSNGDLMGGIGGLIRPGSLAGKADFKRIAPNSPPEKWVKFQPEDGTFSSLAPSDAVEVTLPVLDGQGKLVDVHYVFGSKDRIIYVLMWAKGSNENATDASVAAALVDGMVKSLNEADAKTNTSFPVSAKAIRDLTFTGYAGKQYDLRGDQISGVARVLSKQVSDQREMFMLCVVNSAEDPAAVSQFLNSFKIARH